MAVRKITYQFDAGAEIESGLSVKNAFAGLSEGAHTVTKRLYNESNNIIASSTRNFDKVSGVTEGDNGVVMDFTTIAPKDTGYWFSIHDTADYPMFDWTKDKFVLWSTDHDQTDGAIYVAECDDLLLNGLTYLGQIYGQYQCETPRLINDNGTARIYFHTGTTDPANVPAQSSHCLKTTGGTGQTMASATWTRVDNVLGQFNDDNHTGYMHPFIRGAADWIGHHLGKSTVPRKYYLSESTDGENWTRVKQIPEIANSDGRIPFWRPQPFIYNGKNYSISSVADPNDDTIDYKGIYELDDDLLYSRFMGYIDTNPENIRENFYDVEIKDGYLYFYYCIGDEVNFASTTKLWIYPASNLDIGITMDNPANGSSVEEGQNVILQTTIIGTPTLVEFYDGLTKLGENTSAPFDADFTVTNPSTGAHSYYAIATYASGLTAKTEEIGFTVNAAQLSYILDSYPTAYAYSLRKLRSNYVGNAILAWDSAAGSVYQTVGFNGDDLDTATLDTFSGGTKTISVRELFNQGTDASTMSLKQITANFAPNIVESGTIVTKNTKPSIKFNNTIGMVNTSVAFSRSGDFTVFAVFANDLDNSFGAIVGDYGTTAGNRVSLFSDTTDTNVIGQYAPDGTQYNTNGDNLVISQYYLGRFTKSGNTIKAYINGVLKSETVTNGETWSESSEFRIGGADFASGYLTGHIAEVIPYSEDMDSVAAEIEQNIKDYYNIT